jgi:outer membrane lipopolysaccharide assembly protein LptE/RlpB
MKARGRGERVSVRHSLLVVLLLVAAATLTSSCGYALAGRGSFLPQTIKVIGIPDFLNDTNFYEVEQVLTQKVRSEFIGRGKYKVLPQATGVDAVLKGEITSIAISPSVFNDAQQATRYVITVTAKIEFRDLTADKVLWENPSLVFREDYDVASGTATVTDPATFFGQETNALERVSTNFARSVISAILEAF